MSRGAVTTHRKPAAPTPSPLLAPTVDEVARSGNDAVAREASAAEETSAEAEAESAPDGVLGHAFHRISVLGPGAARAASGAGDPSEPDAEAADDVAPIVQDGVRGGGQSLDRETRSFLEPHFGHDFSQVRIHTDARAAESAQAVQARAYAVGSDVVFGANQYAPGTSDGKRLLAHELTHVVQQSGGASRQAIQPASEHVQRDKTSDKLNELDSRTKVLEKKAAATQLDLKYRALFGQKLSNYKQIVYRLTAGFQTAVSGYSGAHGKQAAQDAVLDQILALLILTAGAAALEPFLSLGLGKLQGALGKVSQRIAKVDLKGVIEKVENPINAAASGAGNAVTTSRAGDRSTNAPPTAVAPGTGAGPGGGDPLTMLASNLEAIEAQNQKIEGAFSARATEYETMSATDWEGWSKEAQEATYTGLLKDLDGMAIDDVNKIESPQTLAVKIELYLWASWIKSHAPGVKGLQIGSELATRLKALGVESLAGVTFDTTSWIFMEHKPEGQWEGLLRSWAASWSQKITK